MTENEAQFSAMQLERARFYTQPIKDGLATDLGEEYTGEFECLEVDGGRILAGVGYEDLRRFSISTTPVGRGGFASVHSGVFNGIERVFKFSPMNTENDKGLDQHVFTNDFKGCWEYRRHVKAATQASGYSSLVDKPIAYFVAKIDDQAEPGGKKTYFVIVMIKRKMNLHELLSSQHRHLVTNSIRLEILKRLKCLICKDDYYRTHGDLKPQNLLVDFDTAINVVNGQEQLVDNSFLLRVTDFGAAGWMESHFSATPLYASPTCFEDSNMKDIFAFTRLVLILFMQRDVDLEGEFVQNTTYWRYLLLLPIDTDFVETFRGAAFSHFPFLRSLRKLLQFQHINQTKMEAETKEQLFDEIIESIQADTSDHFDFTRNQLNFLDDLKKHTEGYFLNAGEKLPDLNNASSYQFHDFHNRTESVHASFKPDNKFLSKVAHNQGSSYQCWAYSAASMLRVSCHKLLEECLQKGRITQQIYEDKRRRLDEDDTIKCFHLQCCKLMTMVLLPKVVTTDDQINNAQQAEYVSFAMNKLAMPSILEDAGVFTIHPVYSFIVNDLGLAINDIVVQCSEYVAVMDPANPSATLQNAVDEDLTPGMTLVWFYSEL